MTNVMLNLEALASGIGKQDIDTSMSFYNIASSRLLDTQAEREAFRYGALAVLSTMAKHRIRAWYYTRKFKKAIEQLTGNER